MADSIQYKFLDIDGVSTFKEELCKVIDKFLQDGKEYADDKVKNVFDDINNLLYSMLPNTSWY